MKTIRFYVCLCAVFYVSSLLAQEELGNGLLFPQFESGIVVFKNGTSTPAPLNYNMLEQKMLFLDNQNNMMEFADVSNILFIQIDERKFFPVSSRGIFYEEVVTGSGSYFVQHKANMVTQGKASAYGGFSQTSAATSVSSIQDSQGGGPRINLKANEQFKMNMERSYYIKSGISYKRFTSAKSLGKLFKGQSAKIESFSKEQSINFSKPEDIVKIVEYSFSLMGN